MIRFKKAIGIKCRELSREIEQNNKLVGAVAFSFTQVFCAGSGSRHKDLHVSSSNTVDEFIHNVKIPLISHQI